MKSQTPTLRHENNMEVNATDLSILKIFKNNTSLSVYRICKELQLQGGHREFRGLMEYRTIHRMVKYLQKLGFLQQLDKHYERGVKHYKINGPTLEKYLTSKRNELDELEQILLKEKQSRL